MLSSGAWIHADAWRFRLLSVRIEEATRFSGAWHCEGAKGKAEGSLI